MNNSAKKFAIKSLRETIKILKDNKRLIENSTSFYQMQESTFSYHLGQIDLCLDLLIELNVYSNKTAINIKRYAIDSRYE